MLFSRSNRAPAIAVSSSEGFCLDGEFWAILVIAAMIADERRVAGLYCWQLLLASSRREVVEVGEKQKVIPDTIRRCGIGGSESRLAGAR